ncbi:uncharacterized protein LOC126842767 [Adelges cooleyi]|uniref:uncharacterized protein LOC126842767 n=1 Tax=Adelges cooleyi TaxID=133065 RepID=UPI00217F4A10|nr:uncharacterized protein LOC126842767 [Adelges cooleyi]
MSNKSCIQDDDLDETVIFCGAVTDIEKTFQKRMPRHTILPADVKLSQSYFQEDCSDEDKENVKERTISEQTIISNESQRSINLGDQSMANIKDETIQISEDSKTFISEFSSPSTVGDIPFSQEVLDTGVLAKYLLKEFTSLDESLAMEQDYSKSCSKDQTTFDETKFVQDNSDVSIFSFCEGKVPDQTSVEDTSTKYEGSCSAMLSFCEGKLTDQTSIEDTSANYEGSCSGDESISYARSSVSSVVERSVKMDDVTGTNICKFVNISEPDCNDSIISSADEGNIDSDDSLACSIIPDEYSITPGKQRLFDLRLAKPSLRAKIFVPLGPYMDRIEETTTPKDVKTNVPTILIDNISYMASEKDLNISDIADVSDISMLSDEMDMKREHSKLMECSNIEDFKIESPEQTSNESAITSQTINEESFNESSWTKTSRLLNSSNVMEVSLNEDDPSVGNMSSLMGHFIASNLSVSAIDENEAIRISPELINYSMKIGAVTEANMSCLGIEPITLEDMSYTEETLDYTISNDKAKYCNVTLDKSYHVMQHNLDFEKSVRVVSNLNATSVNNEGTVSEMNESNLKPHNLEESHSYLEQKNCDQSHNSDCPAERSVELKNLVTNITLVGDISEISKNASLVVPVVTVTEIQEDSIVTEKVSTAEVIEETEQQTSISDLVKEILESTSAQNSSLTNNISSSELSVIMENRTLEDTWNVSNQNVSIENPNLETTDMMASSSSDLLNLSKDGNVIINSKIVDESHSEVNEENTIDKSVHREITKINEQTLINNEQLEMIIVESETVPDNSVLIVADNIRLNESDKLYELTKVVEDSSILEEKSISHSVGKSVLNESNPNSITEVQEKSVVQVDNKVDETMECQSVLDKSNPNPITEVQEKSVVQVDNKVDETMECQSVLDESNPNPIAEVQEKSEIQVDKEVVEIIESVDCKKHNLEIETNSSYGPENVTNDFKIVMLEEVSYPSVQTNLISNDNIQPLEAMSESFSNCVEQTSNLPVNKVDDIMESVDCCEHDLKKDTNNSYDRDSVTNDCKIVMLEEVSFPNEQTNLISNGGIQLLEATSESNSNCVEIMDQTQDIRNGSPKNQKLLDFTILKQQTPMTASQINKQKLFDFSIVDQTPTTKKCQTTFIAENFIKKDALIDFSVADCSSKHLWNLENVTLNNTTDLEDISIALNSTSSTNNSDVSNLNLFNESIKISSSAMHVSQVSTVVCNEADELSVEKKCETNKLDESSSILDETIEQIENLELSPLAESEEMKSFTSSMIEQSVEFGENEVVKESIDFKQPKCINLTFPDFQLSESQQVSKPAIVDFSIIEQHSQLMEPLSNDGNVPVSDLIQMSVVSVNHEQGSTVACNSETSTMSESKLADSSSDDNNETVIHINENEPIVTHNTEMLSDVQMEEMSFIMESPEKSSTCESFHSIELDSVPEDNKRKMEPAQEYNSVEKKMKVEVEEPKTPMSMLFKIRNMFRSSEKPKCNFSSRKENEPCFVDGKHDLTLSTSKSHDNSQFLKPTMSLRKPEVNVKSKIPCKVADKSTMKNIDFNVSGLLNTEFVKPKTGIPKLAGGPVLVDLSNSTKKPQESKIPSKFNK